MRIYVASSWTNPYHDHVIRTLKEAGQEPYDYRNPGTHIPTPENIRLRSPNEMEANYLSIQNLLAIAMSDCFLLITPSGRSAYLEAGFAIALKKPCFLFDPDSHRDEIYNALMTRIDHPAYFDFEAYLEATTDVERMEEMLPPEALS